MKFGGLSEDEVEKIKKVLEQEGISFEVGQDQEIVESNDESMRNNLRHYRPPDVSTHILGIFIDDIDFQKLSQVAKKQLMTFGITDQSPTPEDFVSDLSRPYKKAEKFKLVHFIFKYIILATVLMFVFVMFRLIVM